MDSTTVNAARPRKERMTKKGKRIAALVALAIALCLALPSLAFGATYSSFMEHSSIRMFRGTIDGVTAEVHGWDDHPELNKTQEPTGSTYWLPKLGVDNGANGDFSDVYVEGYDFAGWIMTGDYNRGPFEGGEYFYPHSDPGDYNIGPMPYIDFTAQWVEASGDVEDNTITVSFMPGYAGDEAAEPANWNGVLNATYTAERGDTVRVPSFASEVSSFEGQVVGNVFVPGYKFAGWRCQETGELVGPSVGAMSSANITGNSCTLVALWSPFVIDTYVMYTDDSDATLGTDTDYDKNLISSAVKVSAAAVNLPSIVTSPADVKDWLAYEWTQNPYNPNYRTGVTGNFVKFTDLFDAAGVQVGDDDLICNLQLTEGFGTIWWIEDRTWADLSQNRYYYPDFEKGYNASTLQLNRIPVEPVLAVTYQMVTHNSSTSAEALEGVYAQGVTGQAVGAPCPRLFFGSNTDYTDGFSGNRIMQNVTAIVVAKKLTVEASATSATAAVSGQNTVTLTASSAADGLGSAMSYTWYVKAPGEQDYRAIAQSNTAALSLTYDETALPGDYAYYCEAVMHGTVSGSDRADSAPIATDPVTVTVAAAPKVTLHFQPGTAGNAPATPANWDGVLNEGHEVIAGALASIPNFASEYNTFAGQKVGNVYVAGYKFAGWRCEETGEVLSASAFYFDTAAVSGETATLTALWEAMTVDTYTVYTDGSDETLGTSTDYDKLVLADAVKVPHGDIELAPLAKTSDNPNEWLPYSWNQYVNYRTALVGNYVKYSDLLDAAGIDVKGEDLVCNLVVMDDLTNITWVEDRTWADLSENRYYYPDFGPGWVAGALQLNRVPSEPVLGLTYLMASHNAAPSSEALESMRAQGVAGQAVGAPCPRLFFGSNTDYTDGFSGNRLAQNINTVVVVKTVGVEASNPTAHAGIAGEDAVTLVASADGAPIAGNATYTWYVQGPSDEDYRLIEGETAAQLTATYAFDAEGGSYRYVCEIGYEGTVTGDDAQTSDALRTEPVEIAVEELGIEVPALAPTTTVNGVPSVAVSTVYGAGEQIVLAVADAASQIEGVTLSYQWYVDGRAIAGATTASVAVPNDVNAGAYAYHCVVEGTDGYGRVIEPVASPEITVTVARAVPTVAVGAIQVQGNAVNVGSVSVAPAVGAAVEYAISTNAQAATAGLAWQTSSYFGDLAWNTQYTVYVKVNATANTEEAVAAATVVTPAEPAAPTDPTPTDPTPGNPTPTDPMPGVGGSTTETNTTTTTTTTSTDNSVSTTSTTTTTDNSVTTSSTDNSSRTTSTSTTNNSSTTNNYYSNGSSGSTAAPAATVTATPLAVTTPEPVAAPTAQAAPVAAAATAAEIAAAAPAASTETAAAPTASTAATTASATDRIADDATPMAAPESGTDGFQMGALEWLIVIALVVIGAGGVLYARNQRTKIDEMMRQATQNSLK